jgi:hypothetical protein
MKLLVGAVLLVGLVAVPIERTAACDCSLIEMPEAVREADVAFVGTLREHVGGGHNAGFGALDEWHWTLERSRDAGTGPTIRVSAPADDGANCGVPFGAGERWMVLASVHDGTLQTNGCMPHHRMDGSAPEAEALVEELLPNRTAHAESGQVTSTPVLLVLSVVVAVGGIGFVAFRRRESGSG